MIQLIPGKLYKICVPNEYCGQIVMVISVEPPLTKNDRLYRLTYTFGGVLKQYHYSKNEIEYLASQVKEIIT